MWVALEQRQVGVELVEAAVDERRAEGVDHVEEAVEQEEVVVAVLDVWHARREARHALRRVSEPDQPDRRRGRAAATCDCLIECWLHLASGGGILRDHRADGRWW